MNPEKRIDGANPDGRSSSSRKIEWNEMMDLK